MITPALPWYLTCLWCFSFIGGNSIVAQTCLPDGITFSSQTQIDAFRTNFPDCDEILGDVIIQEEEPAGITNLGGLSGIRKFGQYLEIYENIALKDLRGLESVSTIDGGLNIFGNNALQELSGLDNLQTISTSLRLSQNHELKSLEALKRLQKVGESLTISDNGYLQNLRGLDSLGFIGGNVIIITNQGLLDLQGLDALTFIGGGLLVEENASIQNLYGLSKVASIGGNTMFINNPSLRSLDGLESVESINGNLQIAVNPFLSSITALSKLSRINGLLLIFENKGLKSLSGLDNIDHNTIQDLGILDSDILNECSIKSICDYLGDNSNLASISFNGTGCNFRAQILDNCSRMGQSSSPPQRKDPVFFPNPTSGPVEIKGQGLKNVSVEISDSFGRILMQDTLAAGSIDLSDLAAGMYFIKLQGERIEFIQKIVKLN